MQLKRFTAKDMRAALSLIKEELGPDAIIMSSTRGPSGVEIVAGIEENAKKPAPKPRRAPAATPKSTSAVKKPAEKSRYLAEDEVEISAKGASALNAALQQAHQKVLRELNSQKSVTQEPASAQSSGSGTFARSLLEILERQKNLTPLGESDLNAGFNDDPRFDAPQKSIAEKASPSPGARAVKGGPKPLSEHKDLEALFEKSKKRQERKAELKESGIESYVREGSDPALKSISAEVAALRQLLQFELAGLISDHRTREEPVKAMLATLLEGAGFSKKVVCSLLPETDPALTLPGALRLVGESLAAKIPVGSDEIIEEGGIIALIGPAGVGKTTTLAKLAARFVMRYGAEGVTVISADHYRIGATEQIKTYGRIMGCQALAVRSLKELPALLSTLADKSLVLLDTAGVGLKDARFGTQLAELEAHASLGLKHYLVLPATAQRKVLEKAYRHFARVPLEGLILTKTDESSSLGDALSLCLENSLRLSYVTDGQRVPEDLTVPKGADLSRGILELLEERSPFEDE